DCLPAAVLEVDGDQVRQLHVRTCLARGIDLAQHTDLTVQELVRRAESADEARRGGLLPPYGLTAAQYDYRPVDVHTIPYGAFATDLARRYTRRLLHSHGAVRCLERLLDLLHPQGFVLASDYGQTHLDWNGAVEHQRFSQATFIGVNFPLLKA